MKGIFSARARLTYIYKRFEGFFRIFFKFAVGLYLFSSIRNMIGSTDAALFPVVILAALFAVLPSVSAYFVISLYVTVLMSAHIELSALVFIIQICVILFYIRLAPVESYLIIAALLGYALGVPYAVPIIAGLYFGVTAVFPVVIGVLIHSFAPLFFSLSQTATSGGDIQKLPDTISPLISQFNLMLSQNGAAFLEAFVLMAVVAAVHIISRTDMDFAKEISIAFGGLLCFLGFAALNFAAGENFPLIIVFIKVLLSVILVYIIKFFDLALDYKRAEYVEFTDEHYYYYVKIIPKLSPKKR
ncbi:hypothetical protein AGMMS49975_29270 [Clostridia bacterium]|nr:hypothetical protein AGMMS49975_29270 [Clostridia bacterium]